MSGPNSFDTPETPGQNRQRVAAALELAYQLRKELMERPLPPPEAHEQPIYRLIHPLKPANRTDYFHDDAMDALPVAAHDRTENGVAVSAEEIKRLRRIVNMLTTAMGELNLWLINAGRDVTEIEP